MWEMLFKLIMEAAPIVRYIIFAIIIFSILAVCSITLSGAWKFTKAVDKESKIFDLSKTNSNLVKENEILKKNINMLVMSMESINTYIHKTNEAVSIMPQKALEKYLQTYEVRRAMTEVAATVEATREVTTSEEMHSQFNMSKWFLENITDYVYEIVNLLSSEVSYDNKKRVSLWSIQKDDKGNDTEFLKSIHRSSNFSYSKDKTILLNINESIAGRAFRTKSRQYVTDLENDPDWRKYSIKKKYHAIVAYPIGEHRVLTIDYREKPRDEDLEIAQLATNYLTLLYAFRSEIEYSLGVIENLLEDG